MTWSRDSDAVFDDLSPLTSGRIPVKTLSTSSSFAAVVRQLAVVSSRNEISLAVGAGSNVVVEIGVSVVPTIARSFQE